MEVTTIYGNMDDSKLFKKAGKEEDDNQILNWTEYYLNEELVHRSVDLYLKKGVDFGLDAASIV